MQQSLPPHPIHEKNSHQKGNLLGPFLDWLDISKEQQSQILPKSFIFQFQEEITYLAFVVTKSKQMAKMRYTVI